MDATIVEGHFEGEAAAVAELEQLGWEPLVLDMSSVEEDFHWHDFTTVAFILEGTSLLELADGRQLTAGPGARAELPAGVVHRDIPGSTYRAVIGFSVPMSEMSQPINKPA